MKSECECQDPDIRALKRRTPIFLRASDLLQTLKLGVSVGTLDAEDLFAIKCLRGELDQMESDELKDAQRNRDKHGTENRDADSHDQ